MLKNILTFFAILIASFFILLGAIYVQNLPAPVITPPPIATSTPIVWNPTDINSKDVSITVLEKTADNPATWMNEVVLSASTTNSGELIAPTIGGTSSIEKINLAPNEIIQIGCIEGDEVDPAKGCESKYITQ